MNWFAKTVGGSLLLLAIGACSSMSAKDGAPASESPAYSSVDAASSASKSSTSAATTSPATVAVPNPVALLRKIPGCKLPPGVSVGIEDVFGNRGAECTFAAADSVHIYTNTSAKKILATRQYPSASADDEKIIVGANFVASYVAPLDGNTGGYNFTLSAMKVAKLLGGTLR